MTIDQAAAALAEKFTAEIARVAEWERVSPTSLAAAVAAALTKAPPPQSAT